MDNITLTEETTVPQQAPVEHQFDVETQTPEETQVPEQPIEQEQPLLAQQITSGDLIGIEVTNENVALNLLVSFVNLAHSRNAFNLQESAKIWECIQKFIQPRPTN
jgi:hypothetical protein